MFFVNTQLVCGGAHLVCKGEYLVCGVKHLVCGGAHLAFTAHVHVPGMALVLYVAFVLPDALETWREILCQVCHDIGFFFKA